MKDIRREDFADYRVYCLLVLKKAQAEAEGSKIYDSRTEQVFKDAKEAICKAKPLTVLVGLRAIRRHCDNKRGGTKVAKQSDRLEPLIKDWKFKCC